MPCGRSWCWWWKMQKFYILSLQTESDFIASLSIWVLSRLNHRALLLMLRWTFEGLAQQTHTAAACCLRKRAMQNNCRVTHLKPDLRISLYGSFVGVLNLCTSKWFSTNPQYSLHLTFMLARPCGHYSVCYMIFNCSKGHLVCIQILQKAHRVLKTQEKVATVLKKWYVDKTHFFGSAQYNWIQVVWRQRD